MGPADKTGNAARTARIAEMRRAEQARARRTRIMTVAVSAVVVAGLAAGGVFLVRSQSDDGGGASVKDTAEDTAKNTPKDTADAKSSGDFPADADGVHTWKGEPSRNHVTRSVDYPVEPPVGGDHHPVWLNCDAQVYTEPVRNENAVHALEHGAVWVTYTEEASEADVAALAAKVKRTPYTFMSPDDRQKDPIMLTAWGVQRSVTGAGDPHVDAFLQKYVQGAQTPEPGASCTGGAMK
ncbi:MULTISPECIES: DUF3105 domain-containing protein [unclassified Streptomyces]|uniref:DUF3105 domain-containing protein n=1 Tax=unclassified Streptomyces TaxID=2593676 RepID=UPI003D73C0C0